MVCLQYLNKTENNKDVKLLKASFTHDAAAE